MEQNPNPTPESASAAPVHQAATPQPLTTWPGAFGAYKPSRDAVRYNLASLIYITLINFGVSFVLGLIFSHLQAVGDVLSGITSLYIAVAQIRILLASIRGQKMELGEAFTGIGTLWINLLGASILVGFATTAALLLLVVPVFFVLPRVILTPYFVIDQKISALEAFKASWHATKGHSGKVWGIIGASIVMALPIITIIGIPYSIYLLFMYAAATPLVYDYLRRQAPQAADATSAPVPPTPEPAAS